MIARVATLKFKPDKMDELVRYYDEGIFPVVKQKEGFRGGHLLTDPETGNCIAIGFWDNKDQALADEQTVNFKERLNTIKEYIISPPVWQIYKVPLKY